MKRKADNSFRIWSLAMILAGIITIALDVLLMIARFTSPDHSRFVVLIAAVSMLVCGVCEIAAGVRGITFISSASRGRRYRAISAKILSFKKLSLAAVLLCLLQILLSCLFGIVLWQLAAIAVTGILVPLGYLINVRSLHS